MFQMTPLIFASYNGDLETVRELMRNEKLDVNLHDSYKCTALFYASVKNHLEVVQELLKHHKIDADFRNNFGERPLYSASLNDGNYKVVRALVEINMVDVYGPHVGDPQRRIRRGFCAVETRQFGCKFEEYCRVDSS
jgi:ankyrin repeat protein